MSNDLIPTYSLPTYDPTDGLWHQDINYTDKEGNRWGEPISFVAPEKSMLPNPNVELSRHTPNREAARSLAAV